jgi:hypothetical protein
MVNKVIELQAVFLEPDPAYSARTLLGYWCHHQSEETTENLRAGAVKGPATLKETSFMKLKEKTIDVGRGMM